ncbi:hypothetical protein MASR2M48_15840 [Spirochaetota bacterium]
MATLKKYKDIEKSFAKRMGFAIRKFFSSLKDSISRFIRAGRQKITIMLVPHSEKRILNLQISFFGLAAFAALIIGGVGFLSYSSADYGDVVGKLAGKTSALRRLRPI